MHKNTGHAVTTTWLLLNIQLIVELITNPKMVVNIRVVRDEGAIWVHYKSGSKLINQIIKLHGYDTVWYKPTGIVNIILMSRVTVSIRWRLISRAGIFFRMMLSHHEICFQLIPDGLYYSDAAYRENNMLLLNMVV